MIAQKSDKEFQDVSSGPVEEVVADYDDFKQMVFTFEKGFTCAGATLVVNLPMDMSGVSKLEALSRSIIQGLDNSEELNAKVLNLFELLVVSWDGVSIDGQPAVLNPENLRKFITDHGEAIIYIYGQLSDQHLKRNVRLNKAVKIAKK